MNRIFLVSSVLQYWWGKFSQYGGSGFVVDLPLNRTLASTMLDQLRANKWIDVQTRVVFVDFNTYNPGV